MLFEPLRPYPYNEDTNNILLEEFCDEMLLPPFLQPHSQHRSPQMPSPPANLQEFSMDHLETLVVVLQGFILAFSTILTFLT